MEKLNKEQAAQAKALGLDPNDPAVIAMILHKDSAPKTTGKAAYSKDHVEFITKGIKALRDTSISYGINPTTSGFNSAMALHFGISPTDVKAITQAVADDSKLLIRPMKRTRKDGKGSYSFVMFYLPEDKERIPSGNESKGKDALAKILG